MTKKIDIGSKGMTELVEHLPIQPHKVIVDKMNSRMFPLDLNRTFAYKPELLAADEFKRCLSLFANRSQGKFSEKLAFTRYNGYQAEIKKYEKPHRKKLQDLAISTIKEIYNVPEWMDVSALINPSIDLDTTQDKTPSPFLELSLQEKKDMRDEIQKRIILNGLVHGASMHIWKSVHHMISDQLDAIDKNLRHLYDQYTAALGVVYWLINPDALADIIDDNVQLTQGFNELKFDQAKGWGGTIEANAINFPSLLHEVNKGILDWLISAGIPQEYNEEQLTYYYAQADDYTKEPWHYLLGPSLWVGLLETCEIENEKIPRLIRHLADMSYQELNDLFKQIIDKNPDAKKVINTWNL